LLCDTGCGVQLVCFVFLICIMSSQAWQRCQALVFSAGLAVSLFVRNKYENHSRILLF
jgi:hypothetical protein